MEMKLGKEKKKHIMRTKFRLDLTKKRLVLSWQRRAGMTETHEYKNILWSVLL